MYEIQVEREGTMVKMHKRHLSSAIKTIAAIAQLSILQEDGVSSISLYEVKGDQYSMVMYVEA